jgi:large-conductance mechanosensitive channel
MLQGLKQFMLRGNVLDLAVAVMMGAARRCAFCTSVFTQTVYPGGPPAR